MSNGILVTDYQGTWIVHFVSKYQSSMEKGGRGGGGVRLLVEKGCVYRRLLTCLEDDLE